MAWDKQKDREKEVLLLINNKEKQEDCEVWVEGEVCYKVATLLAWLQMCSWVTLRGRKQYII